ncbi:MAG: serine/threonine-protein kinase, partial [Acidobacteriota bacterium]
MARRRDEIGSVPTVSAEATAPTISSGAVGKTVSADAVGKTVSADAVGETVASVTSSPALLRRGTTLGRYVVLEKLGGGGMGVVYTAYDPELDRRIAIKLLRPGSSGPSADARTRLLREAQALARLSHPNVIAVHDVGVIGEQVFVAMEYVDGVTLHAWTRREPHTWRALVDAYLQAGRGLEAAHAVGIVHRDFKPENVLVGNDRRVRVLDFGLAREDENASRPDPAMKVEHAETVARSQPGLSTPLTSAGEFLGTPAYSSPEQLQGDPADARSDQFSFCVSLYEALYGERPFAGSTFGELVTSVLDGKISAPPARSRVPGRLREVLLRGLRGKPDERYPSMTELLAALAHDPAVKRRRGLAATGVLALAGVAAYGVWGRTRATTATCTGAASKLAGIWDDPVRAQVSRAFVATGKAFAPGAFEGVAHLLDDYAQHWTAMATDACEATHVRGDQSEELLDLREFCLGKRRDALQAITRLLEHPDAKIVQNAAAMALQLPSLEDCADTAQLRAVVKPPKAPA